MAERCQSCVLIVDDSYAVRTLLSRRLGEAGFNAFHAEDGIDALGKLRAVLPKVIISGLEMPRMAGLEFIGVVRRRFPAIPVVALTGSIPREFPAECKPDRWFEKKTSQLPDILRAVADLAQEAPSEACVQQVVSIPVRTRLGFAGYCMLTCTDCLRTFRARVAAIGMALESTAECTHCEARVPYIIESSHPD